MRHNKGFTLVELLAMLVVLAILMGVAVPNITGILGSQRVNTMKADAMNLAEAAKIKVAKDTTIDKPTTGQCLVFSLDSLDDNDDFGTGPNGGVYNNYESFVIYTRVSTGGTTTKFKYYVRLVEETKDSKIGFKLVDSDTIKDLTGKNIEKITTLYGLSADRTDSATKLGTTFNAASTPACTAGIKYYAHIKRCVEENGFYYDKNGNSVSEAVYNTSCS